MKGANREGSLSWTKPVLDAAVKAENGGCFGAYRRRHAVIQVDIPGLNNDARVQTVYAGVLVFLILSGVLLMFWFTRRLIGSLRERQALARRTQARFD
jgi:hypothetical protein